MKAYGDLDFMVAGVLLELRGKSSARKLKKGSQSLSSRLPAVIEDLRASLARGLPARFPPPEKRCLRPDSVKAVSGTPASFQRLVKATVTLGNRLQLASQGKSSKTAVLTLVGTLERNLRAAVRDLANAAT